MKYLKRLLIWKEEGDRTLEYWREVHTSFFSNECVELGIPFEEDALVVCEEFEVVYK